jgi:E3 ubiquitin-protein ligase HUWE1
VLDLTFTAETDFFGRKELVELVPGGWNGFSPT